MNHKFREEIPEILRFIEAFNHLTLTLLIIHTYEPAHIKFFQV